MVGLLQNNIMYKSTRKHVILFSQYYYSKTALRKLSTEMRQSKNLVFNPKSKKVLNGTLSKAFSTQIDYPVKFDL